jgi:hypothetical protein
MFKRTLAVTAAIAAAVAIAPAPAQAIPPGDTLVVIAYFEDISHHQLIGQQWFGCGQPARQWGATTGFRQLSFAAC